MLVGLLVAGCATKAPDAELRRTPGQDLLSQEPASVTSPVTTTQWWLSETLEDPVSGIGTMSRIEDDRTQPMLDLLEGGVLVSEADIVRLTLAHNLNIRISDNERQGAIAAVLAARGSVYDLVAAISARETGTERLDYTSGALPGTLSASPSRLDEPSSVSSSQSRTGRVSVDQRIPTGGTIGLFYEETRNDVNTSEASARNPVTNNRGGVSFSQPLLQGFGPTVTNAPIIIANINRGIQEYAFRDQVANQLANVLRTYYNLVFALENAAVQRIALLQALDLEAINRIRQSVGDLAQVDVEQATAQVAIQEETYLRALQSVQDRQDELSRSMNLPGFGPNGWTSALLPTTQPTYADINADEELLFQTALLKRGDFQQALLSLDSAKVNLRVADNDLLPRLDFTVTYAQIGDNGSASRAREMVRERDYEDYQIGLDFRYPLQNRKARWTRHQRSLDRDNAELRLQDLALQIRQEIRRDLRSLQTARKRIDVTLAGIRAEQAKFDSERRRYDVGLSTSFQLLQALEDLSDARVKHLQAIVDYRLALIELKLSQGTLLGDLGISIGAETVFHAGDAEGELPADYVAPGAEMGSSVVVSDAEVLDPNVQAAPLVDQADRAGASATEAPQAEPVTDAVEEAPVVAPPAAE